MQIQIRNYQINDLDRYNQLYQDNKDIKREARWVSPQTIREFLFSPRCTPDKDLLIAKTGEEIIGLCYLIPEPEIDRAIVRGIVLQRYRRKGIGSELLKRAIKRAMELGVRMVHLDLNEKNQGAREFMRVKHFRKVRTFHEMRLLLEEKGFGQLPPGDIRIRPLKKGQEGLLTEVQNLCFSGSWGYQPNEASEVIYYLGLGKCSYDDVHMAFFRDRPVGFCWLTIEPESSVDQGQNKGRVHMMGVIPAYRRTGLGRSLLVSGLSHLKKRGVKLAELTVDSNNEAAFGLYRSAGFSTYSNTHWFEKAL